MASNFRLFLHETGDSLHLKLYGDFDGSSAHELINALKKNGSKFIIPPSHYKTNGKPIPEKNSEKTPLHTGVEQQAPVTEVKHDQEPPAKRLPEPAEPVEASPAANAGTPVATATKPKEPEVAQAVE